VARILNQAGLVCLAAFVAPDDAVRRKAAERVGPGRFLVIHLAAPVEACRKRDTDGTYARADAGEITNFPGVSAEYDAPSEPDLVLPTHEWPVGKCVDAVVALLEARGIV
jgi:bifunctional enzyme CysN/CysC